MNLKSGYPFWLIKDGLPFNYPALNSNKKTGVLIMGGGISGALAAWHLINEGINCMVVDARTIGLGSSCASTSLLQYEIDIPLSSLQHKVGLKDAVRSYHLCRQSIKALGNIARKIKLKDFEYKQSLYFAAGKKDISLLQEEFEIRRRHGFAVKLLDSQEIKNTFNFSAPSAILSEDGAQTNAYQFTHHLLQDGIKKGLEVYDRTNIVHIDHQQKKVILTTENKHRITARKMVYATGYEVVKYIKKPIVKLQSTFAIISEQANEGRPFWNNDAMIWNTADPYLYMRTTKDNRILVGGRDADFLNPSKIDKSIPLKAKKLQQDFNKLFPHLPFKREFSWAGDLWFH